MKFNHFRPGIATGGWELIPTLKPVGHQSTNCIDRFVLITDIAELTSFGTTSPR